MSCRKSQSEIPIEVCSTNFKFPGKCEQRNTPVGNIELSDGDLNVSSWDSMAKQ